MCINKRIEYLIQKLANGKSRRFAKETGIAPTTINGIVGRRRSDPSFSTLIKIIDTYTFLNINWIIKGEGEPFSDSYNEKTNKETELDLRNKDSLVKISNSIFLSRNLKLLRKHINETQESFARIFGVSRDNIASYERGVKPKIPFLVDIENYYHISLEELTSYDLKEHPEILEKISVPNKKKSR